MRFISVLFWLAAAAGVAFSQPTNDLFANRIALVGTNVAWSGTTEGATREPGEPIHGAYSAASLWYTWTPPVTGEMTLTNTGSRVLVAVYTGTSFTNLVATWKGNLDYEPVIIPVIAGVPLQIAVDITWWEEERPFSCALSLLASPPNDRFADALAITGVSNVLAFTTTGGTREPHEPVNGYNSVWFKWTAPFSGHASFIIESSNDWMQLGAWFYEGTSLTNLTQLAPTSGQSSQQNIPVIAGHEYKIRVGTPYESAEWPGSMEFWVVPAAPNDAFLKSIRVSETTGVLISTIRMATLEPGEPSRYNPSLWWSWTAPANGELKLAPIENSAAADVFTGSELASLSKIVSMGNWSPVTLSVIKGTEYHIALYAESWAVDPQVRFWFRAQPANDEVSSATQLNGATNLVHGTVAAATLEPGETTVSGYYNSSVWYQWTAAQDGVLVVTSADERCEVYTNNNVASLGSPPLESADYYDPLPSWRVFASTTYYIRVLGNNAADSVFTLSLGFTPRPHNDRFDQSHPLLENEPSFGSFFRSTVQAGERWPFSQPSGSVWYKWTATSNCYAEIALDNALTSDPWIIAYTGTDLTNLVQVPYSAGNYGVTKFEARANTEYFIQCIPLRAPEAGTIRVTLNTRPAATNSQFASATILNWDAGAISGHAFDNSVEPAEPLHAAITTPKSMWYSWTPTTGGRATLTVFSTNWYAAVSVYEGASLSNLSLVTQDYGALLFSRTSRVAWEAVQGQQYQIAVAGNPTYAGHHALELTRGAPVVEWKDPVRTIGSTGENVTLSVAATDADDAIERVEFYRSSTLLFADADFPYEFTWAEVPVGWYSLRAVAIDVRGNQSETPLLSLIVRPPNDAFANRMPVNDSMTLPAGFLIAASSEHGDPTAGLFSRSNSLWFSWTAPSNGAVCVRSSSAGYQQNLAIFTGDALTELNLVAQSYPDSRQAVFTCEKDITYAIALVGNTSTQDLTLTISSPISGDNFEHRVELSGAAPAPVEFRWKDATKQAGDPYADKWWIHGSLWLSWLAPSNGVGVVTISPLPRFVPESFVFQGTNLSSLRAIATNVSGSIVSTNTSQQIGLFRVSAGQRYELGMFFASYNATNLSVGVSYVPYATNDEFGYRIRLTGRTNWVSGNNTGATRDAGESAYIGNAAGLGGSLWWSWTAATDGDVLISTTAQFDNELAVFTGTSPSALTNVSSSMSVSSGGNSVAFSAKAGVEYQIRFAGLGFFGTHALVAGDFTMLILQPSAPANDHPPGFVLNSSLGEIVGSTFGASAELYGPYTFRLEDRSVWWSWTAPTSGPFMIQQLDGQANRSFQVFSNRVAEGTLLALGFSDQPAGFMAEAGKVYLIRASDCSTAESQAPVRFRIVPNAPPTISLLSPPHSAAVLAPGTQVISVSAEDPEGSVTELTAGVARSAESPRGFDNPESFHRTFTEAPFTFTIAGSLGEFSLNVRAKDDLGLVTSTQIVFSIANTNDFFAHAQGITGSRWQFSSHSGGATVEAGEPSIAYGYTRTLWWHWAAPHDGVFKLSTDGSEVATVLCAYEGDAITNLTLVGSAERSDFDSRGRLVLRALRGTMFRFAVATRYSGHLRLSMAPAPINDLFAGATPLVGAPLSIVASNDGATREDGEPFHAYVYGAASVWWRWTPTESGEVVITTSSASFDTAMGIYTGSSLTNLTIVAYDDDAERDRTSTCRFYAVAGQPYFIAVDGNVAATGPFGLTIANLGQLHFFPPTRTPGSVSLRLFTDSANLLELQRSTNLLDWETVRFLSQPGSLIWLDEPIEPGVPHLFYRVVLP